MFGAWLSWKRCRALLLHLDRTPLRWAFRRIQGFSWKPLWGLAGGDQMGAYKPLARSLEALNHLRASIGSGEYARQALYSQTRAQLVDKGLKELRAAFGPPDRSWCQPVPALPRRGAASDTHAPEESGHHVFSRLVGAAAKSVGE